MTGLWLLPFVVFGLLGVILLACAGAGATSPEGELRTLVRDHELATLTASLRREPALVRSSRRSMLRNRLVLDLGDVELDLHCYSPPTRRVDALIAVYYRSSVGWVLETTGGGRQDRHQGWLLDVRARRSSR